MSGVTAEELAGHPFLRGLGREQVVALAGAATAVEVPAGHRFFEEGGRAARFWLIRTGHVALELDLPGRAPLIIETLNAGDLVGLSWASPPHEWQYGAVAVQPTQAYEFDAGAIIRACDADPGLGYQFIRRLMGVAAQRMHSSRIRMLDLYASPAQRSRP